MIKCFTCAVNFNLRRYTKVWSRAESAPPAQRDADRSYEEYHNGGSGGGGRDGRGILRDRPGNNLGGNVGNGGGDGGRA
jgi:hypothetical protein